MNNQTLLYLLIASHIVTDFFIQSNNAVEDKNCKRWKSKSLYLHALCAGLTAYLAFLALGIFNQWVIPCIILISHFLIDLGKTYCKRKSVTTFLIDQFLHIGIIVLCWLIYTSQTSEFFKFTTDILQNNKIQLFLLGYLMVTKPASVLIGTIVQRWEKKINFQEDGTEKSGLENAGKWIGYLERILILCFIFMHYYEGIGFLFAAKSIFRFGELTKAKERALTEYILIGTLLSFSLALIVGMLIDSGLK